MLSSLLVRDALCDCGESARACSHAVRLLCLQDIVVADQQRLTAALPSDPLLHSKFERSLSMVVHGQIEATRAALDVLAGTWMAWLDQDVL